MKFSTKGQTKFSWRRISQSEIRNSAAQRAASYGEMGFPRTARRANLCFPPQKITKSNLVPPPGFEPGIRRPKRRVMSVSLRRHFYNIALLKIYHELDKISIINPPCFCKGIFYNWQRGRNKNLFFISTERTN